MLSNFVKILFIYDACCVFGVDTELVSVLLVYILFCLKTRSSGYNDQSAVIYIV